MIEGGRSRTFRSFVPDQISVIFRREHKNGTGDVLIAHKKWRDSDGDNHKEDIGFMRIREPKEVEKRLKRLKAEGSAKNEV